MTRSDQSSGVRLYLSVAQELLTAVAEGEFVPGARLPGDRQLAERLGVSRATVREAILALEVIGAVEVRHGQGTFVRGRHPGVAAIEASALDVAPRELIEARRTLEPVVAGLAAGRADPAALRSIERDLEEAATLVAEPAALPRFMALGLRFHDSLAGCCGNSLLAEVVGQFVNAESHPLWVLVNQLAVSHAEAREAQLREHRLVLEAVAAGDAAGAQRAMSTHLESVDRIIFQPTGSAVQASVG